MSKQKIREWLENNCNTDNIVDIIHQYTQDQSADLDAELEDIINSRDYFEDKATELANDIAEYLGFEVGEHSSANNPIQNAIDTLYCIKNKIGDHAGIQDHSGWVSVKEEGDPMSGDYITYRPCAPTENRVATIRYSSQTSHWSGQYKVTHYMKKPLPPTEGA